VKRYACSDGMCGATDCSTCFPGNDNEVAWQKAKDEHDEMLGDAMRDEAKDERVE